MRIQIEYAPHFLRKFSKLDPHLQDEVWDKINEFGEIANHSRLKVHKLQGKLNRFYAFSVNYKIRIIFAYRTSDKKCATLLGIGGHEIYKLLE